jgi:hypothetical protein
VAKQKLDLFKFASTSMAEARATATKIVGCEIVDSGPQLRGDHPDISDRKVARIPPDTQEEST